MCKCKGFIIDGANGSAKLGNTLGELSLAYLRYMLQSDDEADDYSVVILDQPEDHISNNRISNDLIDYLNAIRYKKQIILATHNPLLVVNLDVDQVLFLQKKNNHIDIIDGPLEMDNENGNMLSIIAENMDGGRDAVLRRMKVYE